MNRLQKLNMFINELKNGSIITISKKDYTPTSFRYLKNKVFYKNKALHGCVWLEHSKSLKELESHFLNMIDENFKIEIEKIIEIPEKEMIKNEFND